MLRVVPNADVTSCSRCGNRHAHDQFTIDHVFALVKVSTLSAMLDHPNNPYQVKLAVEMSCLLKERARWAKG